MLNVERFLGKRIHNVSFVPVATQVNFGAAESKHSDIGTAFKDLRT